MKSAFTHWANLEAARDDSSMNLKKECTAQLFNFYPKMQFIYYLSGLTPPHRMRPNI